jgi:hypothetical protein
MAITGVLYIGTAAGLAIYHDEGGALRRAGAALEGRAVRAIELLLADALLAAADGLPAQQSFDGGLSWADAPGPPPAPLGLRVATAGGPAALANPRLMAATAYARVGGFILGAGAGGALLFRSSDDGIHWEPAASPLAGRVNTIVPAGYRADSAFAGAESGALLRSDDRGASWREVAREPAPILCMAGAAPD